jgi:hypothetical protein
MPPFLQKFAQLIDQWGLTEIVAIGIGVAALLVVFFMPLKDVNHKDDYAGLTYALAIVAIGVTSVVALPSIWRGSLGGLYSFSFCLLVAGLSIVRFRLGGNEVKVVAKQAKGGSQNTEKKA